MSLQNTLGQIKAKFIQNTLEKDNTGTKNMFLFIFRSFEEIYVYCKIVGPNQ